MLLFHPLWLLCSFSCGLEVLGPSMSKSWRKELSMVSYICQIDPKRDLHLDDINFFKKKL